MSSARKEKKYEEEKWISNTRLDKRISNLRLILEMLKEIIKPTNSFINHGDLKRAAKELKIVKLLIRDERIDTSVFIEKLIDIKVQEETPARSLRAKENLEVKGKTIGVLDTKKQELVQVELVVKEIREAPRDLKTAESNINDTRNNNIEQNLEKLRRTVQNLYQPVKNLETIRALQGIKKFAEPLSCNLFHYLIVRCFGEVSRKVRDSYSFAA